MSAIIRINPMPALVRVNGQLLHGESKLPIAEPERPSIGSTAPDAIGLGRIIDPTHGVAWRIRYGGDQGVVVLGPMGKGKGTRILMPNLLQMEQRSILVIDPKGELAAVTAPFRRTLGRVVILNPFGVLANKPGYEDLKSDGFNPLLRLDPTSENFNTDASLLAEALITAEEKDPFFSMSARNLMAALLMWVVIEARNAGIAPTMARVRELLNQPNEPPDRETGFAGTGLPLLAMKMMEAGIPALANKAAQFTMWNRAIQNVVQTAQTQTECFDDAAIHKDLAKGTFDFADMKHEPVTVYLVLPPEYMERHSKWLRIVVTAAIQACMRPREPGEPKVLFMLDEFYALGHLPIIANVWGLVRGYGVQFMPVLQSLPQLKERYPHAWETFLGQAGAVVSFAPNDMGTADWLSKRGGDTQRYVTSSSSSRNDGWSQSGHVNAAMGVSGGTSYSTSTSPTRSPLITPHKMFGLPTGYLLGAFDGHSDLAPIYAPPYYDIKQCEDRARKNPYVANLKAKPE